MYSLGFVCLLSAAVALPTQEQLHTNLPELPPPAELKSEDKDINSDVLHVDDPNPPLLDKPESEEAKNPLESAEKDKAEKNEDKNKLNDDIDVNQKKTEELKESKDSKESTDSKEKSEESEDSKEKSKESKESEESKKPWEYSKDIEQKNKPELEEQKEEKKDKDSKSEESTERNELEGPVIVHVIKKPGQMGFIPSWFPSFPNFQLPWPLPHFNSKLRNGGQQPIYIVRQMDFAFENY